MYNSEKLKKYIKKKYYKDDKKIITIRISDESELYNSLDEMQDTLSIKVTNFLERSAETLLPFSKINIRVVCPSKVDLDNFQKCLHIHYGIENLNYERIEKMGRRKRVFLLIISFLSALSFVFLGESFYEIRSFILSLAIWEYIDMRLWEDEEDEIESYVSKILSEAKVVK